MRFGVACRVEVGREPGKAPATSPQRRYAAIRMTIPALAVLTATAMATAARESLITSFMKPLQQAAMALRGSIMANRRHLIFKSSLRYIGPMSKTVAIVEDDAAIRANYADMLKKHGYQVSAFGDRKSAADAFRTRLPDLALLDIGLADEPDGGFALCRELRAMSAALPIIFLTARDSDFDAVSGLRMGADDYVTKDVALPQLLARISALFRRAELLAQPPQAEEVLERGPLRLDMKRFQALWREKTVDLTLTEFWLAHSLARYPGHVKNRDQLMRDAHVVVDDSTITSHIKRLRRKFLAVDSGFEAIESVYGMGYRWNA
jgi:two-component system, OmpR family, response regulator